MSKAEIRSVEELLGRELQIPPYQRPYKWTKKNITDLLLDIETSIREAKKYKDFKYRVGTVILHKKIEEGKLTYDIVDGQQRILSFLLLKLCLSPNFTCSLLSAKFSSKVTQKNLHENYKAIREWFAFAPAGMRKDFKQAMKEHLEVVVITVDEISEAFQLFDSQNSRGRALYPHDLLKAYHLRVISGKKGEERAVEEWEAKDPKAIAELFRDSLFPIWHWARRCRGGGFTVTILHLEAHIDSLRVQHHAEPVFKLCRTYVKKIYRCLPLLDKTLPDNLVVMKNEITKSVGTLIFRVALGFTFVMHGFQKAFLIGPAAEGAAFAKMGIPAPELSAYFTIGAELIGGALLILGLGTRFAAAAIAIAMAGAFIFVHINDPFITDQKTGAGFEYVFVLGMAAIMFILTGGGRYSLDSFFSRNEA